MAVKAYFNAQGCRNRDGFKLMLRMNRIKAAPMFQFAFPAVLYQFRARGPQLRPLLQFPNRRQTPPGDAVPIPLYFVVYNLRCFKAPVSSGGVLRAPGPPLYGYADRWQKKIGGAEVPARMPGCGVPIPRPWAAGEATVATPEP